MAHVKEGGALAVFPAGEVSSWRTELKAVADPRWKTPAIKLAQHMGTPVVPVWFDGANSLVFQMLGMIHPNLRTLALPNEMLRMRGRSVRMRIGKPILRPRILRRSLPPNNWPVSCVRRPMRWAVACR